jgi:aspartyl-tRNA(Asn)/glutamyl-tRNA(Gln) amidotransferase subunit A
MDGLCDRPLHEVATLVGERQLSPVELLDAVIARTEALEPRINAYITPMFEQARTAARQAEAEILGGVYRGPLHGIPIAVKDNFWIRDVRTTAGSRLLENFIPEENAAAVERLLAAGAVITGKCNMHELATGGTSTNVQFGAVHNPWSLSFVPGGSSGGSAAAVAAGFAFAALGTDTAGSIRQPASYCGLAGLKPTFGRVSNYGVVPLAWTLDHSGPLARTVQDVALVLNATAGYDPRDPYCASAAVPEFTAELNDDLKGLTVGLPRRYFYDQLDSEVEHAVEEALGTLLDLGASLRDVELPSASLAPVIYPFIARPEAASFQEEWLRERIADYPDPAVRRSTELGSLVLATDYLRAQRQRTALCLAVATVLQEVDVLVTPTTPTAAHPIGAPFTTVDGRPIQPFELVVGLTSPFNLAGTPALSLPCGFTAKGLPIGLQFAGRAWEEAKVLRAGAAYERATSWHHRHPSLDDSGA